jgi:solute carrier family 12 (potassium/chloride transporters), member 9
VESIGLDANITFLISTTDVMTDTLILQLGYILLSVPNWKKSFSLRILVFVEYDTEVDEERARLKALLEKLRIEAEVQVFWLASGALATYDYIINGTIKNGIDKDVNQVLEKDEWWQELRDIRYGPSRSQQYQSLGELLSSGRRRGSFPTAITERSDSPSRQDVLGLPKKSTVSRVTRLGANIGIRTSHLHPNVLDDETNQPIYDSSDDESPSSPASDVDFNDAASDFGSDHRHDLTRPLLHSGKKTSDRDLLRPPGPHSTMSGSGDQGGSKQNYGAIKLDAPPIAPKRPIMKPQESLKRSESTQALLSPSESTQSLNPPSTTTQPARPGLSRQSSSMRKFSSRPVPETRVHSEEGGEQRLMFAEETEPARTPMIRSRRNSNSAKIGGLDTQLNIPELMDSFHSGSATEAETRSNYSTQSLPLSFNDLPSRAQHMILNELMRQNSRDTAVLLTTLPIPDEGTCKSQEASLRYLTDIEVMCHDLPPVLLVLSNNMTVTVSL